MNRGELIVYIEKDRKEKYKCILSTIYIMKQLVVNSKMKIVYFEVFKNNRTAIARLEKMQSLSHLRLVELIKDSNPEMLNLINCI